MRLLLSILSVLLLAVAGHALAVAQNGENPYARREAAALEIPSSMILAVEQSASALAAAYVSSLNNKINQPSTPGAPTPTTPPSAPVAAVPPSAPTTATTATTTPATSPVLYGWTTYMTVATVTSYVWTGTGTPTGWPFVTETGLPAPTPAEGAAPAMLVSGIFTTMVAVVFTSIIFVIVV